MTKKSQDKKTTWKDIHLNFRDYKVVNSGQEKEIKSTRLSLSGLELSGYISRKESFAAILFGREEYNYLKTLKEEDRKTKLNNFFSLKPPVIILSRSFDQKMILEYAKKYDVTILKSDKSSSYVNTATNILLLNLLSKYHTAHGNLLEVYGVGVLLIGESGLGKSEISLELIKKGHLFIADDVVEYTQLFNEIVGRANEKTANFIEVRGLGILNIAKLYGVQFIKSSCKIDIIIELKQFNKNENFERLGKEHSYQKLLEVQLPHYKIPVSSGRQIGDIIEVIVGDFKLRQSGYISTDEFLKKFNNEGKK
ncbi:MAG: HPr(Ser) kinase/phosphatase [Mycoplasmoidaceae bacterium]